MNKSRNNKIALKCRVYQKLLDTYENEEKFLKCYEVIDEADYYEIHYAITMLKAFESVKIGDTNIPVLSKLFDSIVLYLSEHTTRRAYFLDLLEEARERKRPRVMDSKE